MAEHDDAATIPSLIRGLLDDGRDLIREELQLARAEIRDELWRAQSAGIAFAASTVFGLVGALLFAIAVGDVIAYLLRWPSWAGYGVTAILLLVSAWGLALYGRGRLAKIRALPETADTLKENLAWMQSKSARR